MSLLAIVLACGARTGLDVPNDDASTAPDVAVALDAAAEDAHVVACPAAPTPLLLASGIQPTYDTRLGIDATSIYMGDGQIVTRFSKCTPGPGTKLTATEPNCGRVLVDDGTVYFLDIVLGGSVRSVPASGGATTTIAGVSVKSQPDALSKVGSTLYYLVSPDPSPGVYSVPAAGGKPFFVGAATGDQLAADAASVYFLLATGTSKWALESRPLAGGPSTYLADSCNDGAIALDDTTVYFSGWGACPGFIRSVSKQGGSPAILAAPALPAYLIVEGAYLYWVDERHGVGRVPKLGGPPEVIVSADVAGIAVDATSLYYSTYEGELYRLDI